MFYGPMKRGTEIERWTFTKAPTKVDMASRVWSDVIIDEAVEIDQRVYVEPFLTGLVSDIRKILRSFARDFR
jgi:hypothetical protein